MDAMEEIKSVLDNSSFVVNTGLTGEVRLLSRKLNSTKEDVIINTIAFGGGQVQEGFFNVNIHLPNLKGQPSDNPTVIDNTQPNLLRLDTLGRAAIDILNEVWLNSSDFSVDSAAPPRRDDKDWYLNIVVRYKALRIDVRTT